MSLTVRDDPAYLGAFLGSLARGEPPAMDGRTILVPAAPTRVVAGVFGACAHHVVAADVDASWAERYLGDDPFGAMNAPFLAALALETGAQAGALDVVLVLDGQGREAADEGLVRLDAREHPRARRAERYRDDVVVYETPDGAGVLILGRGVAGRLEAAFEVEPAARGRGLGRRLVASAAALAPRDTHLYLQCAAGNTASLRAILAAGARPIGSEVLLSATGDH